MVPKFDPDKVDWKELTFLAELTIDTRRYEHRVKQLKAKRMFIPAASRAVLDYEVTYLEEVIRCMDAVKQLMEAHPRNR